MSAATVEKALLRAREAFSRNITKNVDFRIKQLKQLRKFIDENHEELVRVLNADLKKHRLEAVITEIEFVKNDIQYQLNHVRQLSKAQFVPKSMANVLDKCYIKYDPYGVVLIFSAWNYPVQLLLGPLVGAISAGNCALIKPSEVASNTEQLFSKLLPRYLDQDCYHVLTGGPSEAEKILNEQFDFIFFTGSTSIGRIVYNAAAKHLTPVVLELGGKSPCFLDENVSNFETAVRRILWGKLLNAGQTCIAPDYLLCSSKVQDKFVEVSKNILQEFYGSDPKRTDSYCRIINERNFDRLTKALSNTKGITKIGGVWDRSTRYIAPTVVANVSASDSIMQEEIFGPILPILVMESVGEAIDYIKRNPKPLTMYVFSDNDINVQKFINETSSGSLAVNECLLQISVDELPFGGVGFSGMGKYHGHYSFETFSHSKSVLAKDYNPLIEFFASFRYPPYTETKLKVLKQFAARSPLDNLLNLNWLNVLSMAIFVAFGYALALFMK